MSTAGQSPSVLTRLKIPVLVVLALSVVPAQFAAAQDPPKPAKPEETKTEITPLGLDPQFTLDPTAPQMASLPGGLTPAYGQRALSEGEWRFDFHGFIFAPMTAGIGERFKLTVNDMPNPNDPIDQSQVGDTTLHSPPQVPDDRETFSHTGVVPTTYAQLNFSQGNSIVTGNMSVVARQANASTSFLEPPSQLGVTDLFLAIRPRLQRIQTEVFVGAFTSRYGATGEYDEGRYGTPLIARVNTMGERITARMAVGKIVLMAEQGLGGGTNKAGASLTPDVWNDFGNPNAGTTFVHHGHLGAAYSRYATVGLHYLRAWSQDDRGTGGLAPDGSIDIYGADLRLNMRRFGHFYVAGSYVDAKYAGTVSRVISVLNTRGGQGLIENYLGPNSNGNGNLTIIGGQYDLSVGKLLSYPVPFSGDGPDLFVSLFGVATHVNSDDKFQDPNLRWYDNVNKWKFGAETTYSFLSWMAASARFDRVTPDTLDSKQSFSVISPRLIFRTDWLATDQIVLQYSRWFYAANTLVRVGDPPRENINFIPDTQMISLTASMWW
jgi:hypothetical protein